MTEPMSLARFRELADAYGGVVDRWPEQHRAAARALATHPIAATVLTEAAALDDVLDIWRMPAPSPELVARVAGTATGVRRRLVRRARLWWSGLGIATALAGAAAGTAAVAAIGPAADPVEAGGAFGDPGADGASDTAS